LQLLEESIDSWEQQPVVLVDFFEFKLSAE
jgi:hypothetical protein